MISLPLLGLLALVSVADGYASHHNTHAHAHAHAHDHNQSSSSSPFIKRADKDPSDMSWIKRWAAIGDSYTAGIGAGRALGHHVHKEEIGIIAPDGLEELRDNWRCARYDRSYPKVIEAQFGSHVQKNGGFQYLACSGDRSEQIYQQAQALKGQLDFVTFTSGGNDLCLAGMIKDCIMVPYFKNSVCETIIAKAEENAQTMVKDNIVQILNALDEKMNRDGIVVVNGYARFFNEEDEFNCEKQSWDMLWMIPGLSYLYQPLTLERRQTFNNLVILINKTIREAVNEVAGERGSIKYKVGYADWDEWVAEEVDGQMCSPRSNGDYPDKNQPDMHFIKRDTHPWWGWDLDVPRHDEFRKRDMDLEEIGDAPFLSDSEKRDMDLEELLNSPRLSNSEKREVNRFKAAMEARDRKLERNLYDSLLYKTPDPRAAVKHKLDARAPSPPGCPGDGGPDMTFGLGMPDSIGRNFHPNEAGHLTIASFALAELMDLRSLVLGVDSPACEIEDEFTCFSETGSKYYVNGNRTNMYYKDFCQEVEDNHDKNAINWRYSKTYDEGTPDVNELVVQMMNDASQFNKDQCIDSFNRIINSCDKSENDNPKNWKGGGRFVRENGDVKYEMHPRRDNRVWPPSKEPYGTCHGQYWGVLSAYTIRGTGFATWDKGAKIRKEMDNCYGLGTTAFKFNYIDNPQAPKDEDDQGYEWKLTFNTPIWTNARCFDNNKIVKKDYGWTNGCSGTG